MLDRFLQSINNNTTLFFIQSSQNTKKITLSTVAVQGEDIYLKSQPQIVLAKLGINSCFAR